MKRKTDTPEEAKIRKEIERKGLAGRLSPKMVLRFPITTVEPLIMQGLTDFYLSKELDISIVPTGALRKYYGLMSSIQANEMLACIKKEPDEVLEMNVTLENDGTTTELVDGTVKVAKKEEVPMTINEARVREGLAPLKEMTLMQTSEPPLLDIENQATIITPLLQGIAKYLERLGKQNVQVTVMVRKVD